MTAFDDDPVNDEDANPSEETGNRTFLLAAGGLGLLVLASLLCLGGYLFFLNTSNQQSELTSIAMATQQHATIQAGIFQTTIAQAQTEAAQQMSTIPPTNTPIIAEATTTLFPSPIPATATLALAGTQASATFSLFPPTPTTTPGGLAPTETFTQTPVSTQTIISTSTALPNAAEDTPTPATPFTGMLEMTYPLEMTVDQEDIVTVEIQLNPKLAGLGIIPNFGTAVISIETNSEANERAIIEEEIELYPVMFAELTAPNFEVPTDDSNNRRTISPDHPAAWTWSIIAKKSGTQKLTIKISGEAVFGAEKITVLAKSITKNITVLEKPILTRFFHGLASNWVPIVSTGGPLGLLLAYLTFRANRENKELKSKVADLEKKQDELRKAIRKRG